MPNAIFLLHVLFYITLATFILVSTLVVGSKGRIPFNKKSEAHFSV